MWRCSNCNKLVDEDFYVCWNCGRAGEGSEPSGLGVSDTCAELEADVDSDAVDSSAVETAQEGSTSATRSPQSAGGMTRREVAELICKTIALVLFSGVGVFAVGSALLFLGMIASGQFQSRILLLFVLPFGVAAVGIGALYWFKSEAIASRMVSDDPTPVTSRIFSVSDAMTVTFSTVGLLFLVDALRELFEVIYWFVENSFTTTELLTYAGFWSVVIRIGLAAWLLVGARGIVGMILRWRRSRNKLFDNDDVDTSTTND